MHIFDVLEFAVRNKKWAIAQAIIDDPAFDINSYDARHGALGIRAADKVSPDLLAFLLKQPAFDVNRKHGQFNLVQIAVLDLKPQHVRLLVEHPRTNWSATNENGQTVAEQLLSEWGAHATWQAIPARPRKALKRRYREVLGLFNL